MFPLFQLFIIETGPPGEASQHGFVPFADEPGHRAADAGC